MTTRATRSPRRRTVVALAVVLAIFGTFAVRLVDIQVVNAAGHVADSEAPGRLGIDRVLTGSRGSIIDENGKVLAQTVSVYDAQLSPMLIEELENGKTPPKISWADAAGQIAEITGQDADEIRDRVAAKLEANPTSQYLPLASSLSTEQYLQLRELGLAYLAMKERTTRVYPQGAVAGNVIGFVGSDGAPLEGMEIMADECLAPTDGQQTYLRGKSGNAIPGSEQVTEPIDGGTVELTINADLAWYLQQMIAEEVAYQKAQSGSVTVVEVATGKIRAAAEYPVVDPNDINASDAADRGNRIFRTTFEPGSTFKAVTAAAVLEEGAATPLSTVSASSRERFPNGESINDAFPHPKTNYTLAGALIVSSNIALSKFGSMISAEKRHDYLEAFGVGEKTAVGFLGEASGLLHDADKWDNRTYYTTTFGQAFTVTAAQVASVYQTIANGGVRMPLQLVESCTLSDGTVIENDPGEPVRVVSESTADEVALMLENVASQGGLSRRIEVSGYRLASKTGTAQKPAGNGKYKDRVRFTSIVGFAPAEDPQYVVVVTLDEPTTVYSSSATASAFQKAMTQVLKTYRVHPSTTPTDTSFPISK